MDFPISQEKPKHAEAVCGARDRDVFGILLVLYSLILYPILRADRYFNDDLKRALVGRAGWDSNGRPLTTLVMRMLQCYDHAMVDISPLPQIGAVAILAWVGVLIARRYSIGSSWTAALVAFPLGAQPFYLENLSYKFDALSMSLAMLLAVLPMLQLNDSRRAWWLGVMALLGSLCFYQPAINVYLVFVLVEWVLLQLQRAQPSQLAKKLIWRSMQIGTAMLLYYLLVGIHVSGWVKHSSERIRGWHELPLLLANFVDFYEYIGASFNGHWWMYFGPLLTVLALFPVVVGIRYALTFRTAQPAPVTVLLCLAALLIPLAALIAALGPMLLLKRPEFEPRVLMGLGALLAGALVVMQAALRQWHGSRKWAVAAACLLSLGMCILASAYGNATIAQKDYESRIAGRLADDLAQLKVSRGVHAFLLDGTAGYSPVTAHVIEQLPLIRVLVPQYLTSEHSFQTPDFLAFYISDMTNLQAHDDVAAQSLLSSLQAHACLMPADIITAHYRLYVIGDTAVVRLSPPGESPECVDGKRADEKGLKAGPEERP
ncbi:MAG TPA: glucosyltransferase domain-containing protein [Rhodanobacter sp.]|nr:glucosyltransferase domain-containing protein [Rhodanobacter sp.]